MEKNNLRKILTPFPSSFHMSNEGEKKTLTSTPLPLNNKRIKKNKIKAHPFPLNNQKINQNNSPCPLQ
jgi:hypothetical protein